MRTIIELENMSFYAPHGCYDLEKRVGNRYSVTLRTEAEAQEAAVDDTLTGTVNYLTLYEIVKAQMSIPSDTLENAAYRILRAVHAAFPKILTSTVKVSKLAPPLGGKVEKASVTLSM